MLSSTNNVPYNKRLASGKKFSHMKIISRKMTEAGAMKKEEERLDTYRQNHHGENPKYNED